MSPALRRFLITLAVIGLAAVVVLVTVVGGRNGPAPPSTEASAEQQAAQPDDAGPGAAAGDDRADAAERAAGPEPTPPEAAAGAPLAEVSGPSAAWVQVTADPAPLGALDPHESKLYLEFSPAGAGLSRITISALWLTAAQSHQAQEHYDALSRGDPDPPPLPDPSGRYVLQKSRPYTWYDEAGTERQLLVPQLAAYYVSINDQRVPLLSDYTDEAGDRWTKWRETGPGAFDATVVDADETPIARITRRFTLGTSYDLTLEQRVENLSDGALEVRWMQYGPGDLIVDRSRYMDRRRFRIAYLPDPANLPELINARDNDMLFEHGTVVKQDGKADEAEADGELQRARELRGLWPNEAAAENGWALSWFAATNRYFALVVHPLLDVSAAGAAGDRSLPPVVTEIRTDVPGEGDEANVFTTLTSAARRVEPGGEAAFDLGVYAGPQDRQILSNQQPMKALAMKGLVLYQMSAFCAVCTFQWLAVALLEFLSGVHFLVRDWGVAIILLVVVVRALLHPLTKRAQINMQRFGKVMGELKPEIEKLQKKYPNDAKRLQAEQMKLMRERGINPFQMLGCLPMFLQMPIWVALYAMLYFAFELRHEPAFWGLLQEIGGWPFLADLAAADHCFWEFQQPHRLLMWNVTGINLLPILLGVVFFIQQKYMSPPPSPSMTKEQIQQQKIMKVLMVVMFPVMLYSAPSGLTLYICTSSFLGILESRYVRAHIKAMDLNPPKPKGKSDRKKKPKDLQARLYASAMERAQQKARERNRKKKSYKKRK